ncbi:MAG: cell division protein FtsL [Lachnospiraceae bacterium]|nr:cell division protein FtsL [Lachnospiraceae bacterium]
MASSQGRQYKSTRQTTYRNSGYVYGNAARQPERVPVRQPERRQAPREVERPQARPVRHAGRKSQFSVPFFMFLMCTIAFCGVVLVNYVSVRSEITARNEQITLLESTLNDMRLENDEDYSRIRNGIDLNEIKMKAIGKLGMTYAAEGQIIYYTEMDDDYVRQVSDIPKK